ncbi:MAG: hypothetical protein QOK42_1200 [Frankiaceae bacterium]|nr:hypothetical protein [Frankiaceae bacterium]MDX6225206.1 hypothetical protein [Frankiales bacterium]
MPYQRGAGMDETQAHGMALEVAHESGHATRVQREGHFFTVTVELPTGVVVLRDEEDRRWLRARLEDTQ